jgi:hypothetical protein
MMVGEKPVCPGCWGTDAIHFSDFASAQWLCPNPDCLYCYFDPDDPDDQPGEILMVSSTTIGLGTDGRIEVTWDAPREP